MGMIVPVACGLVIAPAGVAVVIIPMVVCLHDLMLRSSF
jgi:hypothetical protein